MWSWFVNKSERYWILEEYVQFYNLIIYIYRREKYFDILEALVLAVWRKYLLKLGFFV